MPIKYFDILAARKAYLEGKNVVDHLREQHHAPNNTSEIIETAYDLQAGTYIEQVRKDNGRALLYASELAEIINKHIKPGYSLLDIGTGEMTTISLIMNIINSKPKQLLAFDISWSRIYKGLQYAKINMKKNYDLLCPFVADISEIPLPEKSVNITTSSHALEPNGGNLEKLISELFRVTVDKLVLFEPCYEINSDEGKKRMDSLGYIKNIESVVKNLGGNLVDIIKIDNVINPLNPTACYVIVPPIHIGMKHKNMRTVGKFSVPGTNFYLEKIDNFFFSKQTGLCFPILRSVPVLRSSAAILATAFGE